MRFYLAAYLSVNGYGLCEVSLAWNIKLMPAV